MVKTHDTDEPAGDWCVRYNADDETMPNDGIALLLLSDLRREARKQNAELARQTEIFRRIDERLKRNGMSLAKRNRK